MQFHLPAYCIWCLHHILDCTFVDRADPWFSIERSQYYLSLDACYRQYHFHSNFPTRGCDEDHRFWLCLKWKAKLPAKKSQHSRFHRRRICPSRPNPPNFSSSPTYFTLASHPTSNTHSCEELAPLARPYRTTKNNASDCLVADPHLVFYFPDRDPQYKTLFWSIIPLPH